MSLKRYGVLKGTVIGHLRDADDDHYQILVSAAGEVHRTQAFATDERGSPRTR